MTFAGPPTNVMWLKRMDGEYKQVPMGQPLSLIEGEPVSITCRVIFPSVQPRVAFLITRPSSTVVSANVTDQFVLGERTNDVSSSDGFIASKFEVDYLGSSGAHGYRPDYTHDGGEMACVAYGGPGVVVNVHDVVTLSVNCELSLSLSLSLIKCVLFFISCNI